jgi:hypothetical protein
MALLDVRAAARADGGHELAGLHAALVIRAGPDIERIQRQIQHLLSTYTNTEESSLVTVGDGDHRRFTLRDRRLPDWCVIEWGRIGALYVVTVGEGAFERIVRTIGGTEPALTDDAWFDRAVARTHVQEASHMLLMRFDLLRAAGDAAYTHKALNVQRALELDGVDRGVWTARRKGRSGEVLAFLRRNGEESLTPIAGEAFLRDLPPDIIPDGATRFVVFRCEPAAAVRTLAEAYLLSRDPAQRTESRTFWRSLQKEAGVSFETDLFSQLGSRIVMHDYPPHALGLSLARTFLFPINGDAAALRDRIDRLLEHVAKSEGWPPIPQLRRNDRGVWYLFAGLAGPALTVTDDWLVVSFSPEAVRAVVDGLRPAAQSVASEP